MATGEQPAIDFDALTAEEADIEDADRRERERRQSASFTLVEARHIDALTESVRALNTQTTIANANSARIIALLERIARNTDRVPELVEAILNPKADQ